MLSIHGELRTAHAACRCIVESVGLGFDPEDCKGGHVDADRMYIVQARSEPGSAWAVWIVDFFEQFS